MPHKNGMCRDSEQWSLCSCYPGLVLNMGVNVFEMVLAPTVKLLIILESLFLKSQQPWSKIKQKQKQNFLLCLI